MNYKIELSKVNKSFGGKQILKNIDLKVDSASSLVILGGSGSGKSVLIKTICGLYSPQGGSIKIDGKEMVKNGHYLRDEQHFRKIGYLFQSGALFDSLKVWENVAFRIIQDKKLKLKEAKDLAIENMEMVGLKSFVADQFPSELSGGMQRRVALARTIINKPEIIFFDEPTTGLDPIMADVINNLIIENSKKLGATTITITHDMNSAKKISDKIAMLYKGEIIWQGNSSDMFSSNNEIVDQFVHGRAEGPITR